MMAGWMVDQQSWVAVRCALNLYGNTDLQLVKELDLPLEELVPSHIAVIIGDLCTDGDREPTCQLLGIVQ